MLRSTLFIFFYQTGSQIHFQLMQNVLFTVSAIFIVLGATFDGSNGTSLRTRHKKPSLVITRTNQLEMFDFCGKFVPFFVFGTFYKSYSSFKAVLR